MIGEVLSGNGRSIPCADRTMTIVCLHIGAMKSGTTFLQRVLTRNKRLLLRHGGLFPGQRWNDQVMAVNDVKGGPPRGEKPRPGAWDALVQEVLAFRGDTAVISMEALSLADAATARRVIDSFPDREVRVILTARDLGRVVPAQWQESVKNGVPVRFGRYLALISAPGARRLPKARPFWGTQDLPRILGTWQSLVGAQNLVLVTVPPPGAPSHTLWDRFREAASLPAVPVDLDVRRNPSLGTHSVELIRSLNELLPVHDNWRIRRVVKHSLANGVLSHRAVQEPALTVPHDYRSWVARTAEKLVREINEIDPLVVGTTDDLLVPAWKEHPGGRLSALLGSAPPATEVTDAALLACAIDAVAGLLPLIAKSGEG